MHEKIFVKKNKKNLILFSLLDIYISYNKQNFENKKGIFIFFPQKKGIFNFTLKGGNTNNILYNRFQT